MNENPGWSTSKLPRLRLEAARFTVAPHAFSLAPTNQVGPWLVIILWNMQSCGEDPRRPLAVAIRLKLASQQTRRRVNQKISKSVLTIKAGGCKFSP